MNMRFAKLSAAALVAVLSLGYSSGAGAVTCPAGDTCTTYDLKLTPKPFLGSTGGTGTLFLDGTSGNDVLSLDVTFTLPNLKTLSFDFAGTSLTGATADVLGGTLIRLDAVDAVLSKGAVIFADQSVTFLDFKKFSYGSIDSVSASEVLSDPPPPPAPLPGSWTVMLIGLLGFGIVGLRKRALAKSPAIAA